jgi:hypothetical protein
MAHDTLFVGLDVHKDSITAACVGTDPALIAAVEADVMMEYIELQEKQSLTLAAAGILAAFLCFSRSQRTRCLFVGRLSRISVTRHRHRRVSYGLHLGL